jgi:predicted metalloprotease with PDZ domain
MLMTVQSITLFSSFFIAEANDGHFSGLKIKQSNEYNVSWLIFTENDSHLLSFLHLTNHRTTFLLVIVEFSNNKV